MKDSRKLDSPYDAIPDIAEAVARGQHREVVGGLWSELGWLQFDFLVKQRLRPDHKLLDIGCGSLRGGVHFVRYLNPGHYFGTDINRSLLDAGYEKEIAALNLVDRLPRSNLIEMHDFAFESLDHSFDFALAQSLFTHLTFNNIRQCLARLPAVMRPGAVLYATFFELPDHHPSAQPYTHEPGSVTTFPTKDPYGYALADMQHATLGLPWKLERIGDWNHPRAQKMLAFTRLDSQS